MRTTSSAPLLALLTLGTWLSACSGEPAADDGDSPGGSSSSGGKTGGGGAPGRAGAGPGGATSSGGNGSGGDGLGGAGGAGGLCPAGSFLSEADEPASCAVCPPETFSAEPDSTSCAPRTVCEPWMYLEDGTSTSDAVCSDKRVRQFGTSDYDSAQDLTVDRDGNVYVVGMSLGPIDGAPPAQRTGDVYLKKFDAQGRVLWTRSFRADEPSEARRISIDPAGDLVIAGSIDQPGSLQRSDVLVRKHDAQGKLLWERQFGSSASEYAQDLVVDSNGNIFVAGSTRGEIGGPPAGNLDAFVVKLDPRGETVWARQFATSRLEEATALAVDSKGNLLVAGSADALVGQASFGKLDGFVRKYDADGTLVWSKQFGTQESDEIVALALGPDDEIYVVGSTLGALVGTNQGSNDTFVRKLDADGDELWTRQFGSSHIDSASDVLLTASGDVLVVGSTYGALYGEHAGRIDSFFTVFDANGEHLEGAQFGTSDIEYLRAAARGPDGTVFACGSTYGSLGREQLGLGDAFVLPLTLP